MLLEGFYTDGEKLLVNVGIPDVERYYHLFNSRKIIATKETHKKRACPMSVEMDDSCHPYSSICQQWVLSYPDRPDVVHLP